MNKLTTFGIAFAVLMLFLNLVGYYDFVMVMTHDQTYLTTYYNQAIEAYFMDYPIFFAIVWAAHLLCGIFSPICYIFKSKLAVMLAGFAFGADIVLIALTSLFKNRIQVFGGLFAVDLALLGLIGMYFLYLNKWSVDLG